jgi:hypothetical protein
MLHDTSLPAAYFDGAICFAVAATFSELLPNYFAVRCLNERTWEVLEPLDDSAERPRLRRSILSIGERASSPPRSFDRRKLHARQDRRR